MENNRRPSSPRERRDLGVTRLETATQNQKRMMSALIEPISVNELLIQHLKQQAKINEDHMKRSVQFDERMTQRAREQAVINQQQAAINKEQAVVNNKQRNVNSSLVKATDFTFVKVNDLEGKLMQTERQLNAAMAALIRKIDSRASAPSLASDTPGSWGGRFGNRGRGRAAHSYREQPAAPKVPCTFCKKEYKPSYVKIHMQSYCPRRRRGPAN